MKNTNTGVCRPARHLYYCYLGGVTAPGGRKGSRKAGRDGEREGGKEEGRKDKGKTGREEGSGP